MDFGSVNRLTHFKRAAPRREHTTAYEAQLAKSKRFLSPQQTAEKNIRTMEVSHPVQRATHAKTRKIIFSADARKMLHRSNPATPGAAARADKTTNFLLKSRPTSGTRPGDLFGLLRDGQSQRLFEELLKAPGKSLPLSPSMRSQVLQYVGFIEKRNANRRELFIKKLSNQIQTSFNSGEEYVFNTRSQRLNRHHPVLNEDDYDDKLRKVDEFKPYRYRSHWRSTATTAHGQGGPASRAASLHKHSAPASPNAARRSIVRGS